MNKQKEMTMSEALQAIEDGTAKEGNVIWCTTTNGAYICRDNGWTCVKTKQPGYEYLYGHEIEQ